MNGHVERTPQAKADLVESYAFIARDNPTAAEQFLEAAQRAFETLAAMPRMGQAWPTTDERLAGVRFWPIAGFERHLVFYRPTDDGIAVIRVLHSARDIPSLLP